jgi:hypothetical protein
VKINRPRNLGNHSESFGRRGGREPWPRPRARRAMTPVRAHRPCSVASLEHAAASRAVVAGFVVSAPCLGVAAARLGGRLCQCCGDFSSCPLPRLLLCVPCCVCRQGVHPGPLHQPVTHAAHEQLGAGNHHNRQCGRPAHVDAPWRSCQCSCHWARRGGQCN